MSSYTRYSFLFAKGCFKCPKLTYNLDGFNISHPVECRLCENEAICDEGGAAIKVRKGYWTDPRVYADARSKAISLIQCESGTCCDKEDGCKVEEQCMQGTNGKRIGYWLSDAYYSNMLIKSSHFKEPCAIRALSRIIIYGMTRASIAQNPIGDIS